MDFIPGSWRFSGFLKCFKAQTIGAPNNNGAGLKKIKTKKEGQHAVRERVIGSL